MNDQANIFFSKPVEKLANENYLGDPQDTEIKRKIINCIKVFKEFKEDVMKYLNEIKKKEPKEDKCPSNACENTNMRLMEMMETI